MLCPVCGQIYWKAAVDKAMAFQEEEEDHRHRIEARYIEQSRRSVERIRARVA